METKNIYIILSKTQTRFGRLIRLFGKQKYNHVSICLDDKFQEIYAFARPQYNAALLATLVKEDVDRYTMNRDVQVPIAVMEFPLTKEKYEDINGKITEILEDKHYYYNLFSVLSFPLIKGFHVYKTFTCVEFVAYLLEDMGYFNRPCYQYTPDDFFELFSDRLIYSGDIRGCIGKETGSDAYFAPMSRMVFLSSIKVFFILIKRTMFNRGMRTV